MTICNHQLPRTLLSHWSPTPYFGLTDKCTGHSKPWNIGSSLSKERLGNQSSQPGVAASLAIFVCEVREILTMTKRQYYFIGVNQFQTTGKPDNGHVRIRNSKLEVWNCRRTTSMSRSGQYGNEMWKRRRISFCMRSRSSRIIHEYKYTSVTMARRVQPISIADDRKATEENGGEITPPSTPPQLVFRHGSCAFSLIASIPHFSVRCADRRGPHL